MKSRYLTLLAVGFVFYFSNQASGAEKKLVELALLKPSVAAAWAVAQLGQSDPATLEALQKALKEKIPAWAKKDFQATLHVLHAKQTL